MELSERLNEIRKIFARRKTIELKPTIQPEEVGLLVRTPLKKCNLTADDGA